MLIDSKSAFSVGSETAVNIAWLEAKLSLNLD